MPIVLCALLQVALGGELPPLWQGLTPGRYAIGVRVSRGTDGSRSYRRDAAGVPVQLVLWYPAREPAGPARHLTQLDYEMLNEPGEPTDAKRQAVAEDRAALAMSWRHVGIVPQTREQAIAALNGSGVGVMDAVPAPGRFPVVVIGSPSYLSTTAEFLASQGYLVASAVHFGDAWAERPPPARGMTYEPSLRDQEWALAQLAGEAMADLGRVAALGHGGGGLVAVLLAERQASIDAVVSLDAGSFSSRSDWGEIPFAGPLLLGVPMLNLMRQETRESQDRYADFAGMRYSERYEVLFKDAELRHHDLSNVGRGVSTVLRLRGPEQAMVLDRYAAMHRVVLAFLDACIGASGKAPLAGQLSAEAGAAEVHHFGATVAAPSLAQIVEAFSRRSATDEVAELRRQHAADPEALSFTATAFREMAEQLTNHGRVGAALELLAFGAELHPGSSEIAEATQRARQATR